MHQLQRAVLLSLERLARAPLPAETPAERRGARGARPGGAHQAGSEVSSGGISEVDLAPEVERAPISETEIEAAIEALRVRLAESEASIAKPEAEATTFLTLATDGGRTLNLTAEHHLPVGSTCCSTLKQAKDVAAGETVWAVEK